MAILDLIFGELVLKLAQSQCTSDERRISIVDRGRDVTGRADGVAIVGSRDYPAPPRGELQPTTSCAGWACPPLAYCPWWTIGIEARTRLSSTRCGGRNVAIHHCPTIAGDERGRQAVRLRPTAEGDSAGLDLNSFERSALGPAACAFPLFACTSGRRPGPELV